METSRKRQISAGHVLTKSLLSRLNNKAWHFGIKGHFEIIKEAPERKAGDLDYYFNRENRAIVDIPLKAIKGNPDIFIRDFEKTMAATQYQIQLF